GPTISIFMRFPNERGGLRLLVRPNNSDLLDQSAPLGVRRGLAGHQIEIGLLQLFGHRATATNADLTTVDFADRRDFGGSTGEERFVGDIYLVAGDALLDEIDAELARQGQHGATGDAIEAGGDFRGVDHT